MRLIYIGSGQIGIESLDSIKQSGHTLELIITQPARPAGRGKKLIPTPVAIWATENDIPFIEAENINAPEIIEKIKNSQPELGIVIAFGQKISNEVINLSAKNTINVHASLLPKYRGAAPINRAIINGEKQTGVTIQRVVEKMDAGAILSNAKVTITDNDTAETLSVKLARVAAPLLIETIDRIEKGEAKYTDQDESKVTQAPKLKKSTGYIDFANSAKSLQHKIRGLWPWPGASADYINKQTGKKERVIIAMAELIETQAADQPGSLDENLNIICSQGALKVTKIKPAAGKLMDFKAFTNGRRCNPGDVFEKVE